MTQINPKSNLKDTANQTVNPEHRIITFDQLPSAVAYLIDEINGLKLMIQTRDAKPLIEPESKYIYSIKGLAAFLNCSQVTAQKLKNEGKFHYRQIGRKVIFETSEVLRAMEGHIPGNRSRNYRKS